MVHPPEGKYNYSGLCNKRREPKYGCKGKMVAPHSLGTSVFNYFCGLDGVAGVLAGAGCVLTGCDWRPCNTDFGPLCLVE